MLPDQNFRQYENFDVLVGLLNEQIESDSALPFGINRVSVVGTPSNGPGGVVFADSRMLS